MIPKFIRKLLGTDGVSQMISFINKVDSIDFSEVNSDSEFTKIVSGLTVRMDYLFDDDEQKYVLEKLIEAFYNITYKFCFDGKTSYGEYKVGEYIFELIEKFSQGFTQYIDDTDKECIKGKMNVIYSDYSYCKRIKKENSIACPPGTKGLVVQSINFKRNYAIEEYPEGVPHKEANETYEDYTNKLLEFFKEKYPGSKISNQDGCIVWKIGSDVFYFQKKAEDKRTPYCPNCGGFLQKIPERKKKCEHCGKYIFTFSSHGVKELRKEEIGEQKYRIEREREERWMKEKTSPEYINKELDDIEYAGFKRVLITGSGCDFCMNKINKSITISEARNMIGKPLSIKCECPYYFIQDFDSRKYD